MQSGQSIQYPKAQEHVSQMNTGCILPRPLPLFWGCCWCPEDPPKRSSIIIILVVVLLPIGSGLFLSLGLYPFLYLFLCGCYPAGLGSGTILGRSCCLCSFGVSKSLGSLFASGLFAFSGAFRLWGPFAVILTTLIKKSLGRQGGHAASALEGQHGVRLKHRS